MTTFLYACGGVFFGGMLLLVGGYLFLKSRLNKLQGSFKEMTEELAGDLQKFQMMSESSDIASQMRLELIPIKPAELPEAHLLDQKFNDLVRQLKELGFEEDGHFELEHFSGPLTGLIHAETSTMGCVFTVDEMGSFIDLVCNSKDGKSICATTSPETGLDHPPYEIKIHAPEATAQELFAKLKEAAELLGELQPLGSGDFQSFFEQSHADKMDWRVSVGGYNLAEMKQSMINLGDEPDEEQLGYILEATNQLLTDNAEVIMMEALSEQTDYTMDDLADMEGSLLFIHPMTEKAKVGYCMGAIADLNGEDDAAYESAITRLEQRFEKLLAESDMHTTVKTMIKDLPGGDKVKFLGTVTTPVEAHAYEFPEYD